MVSDPAGSPAAAANRAVVEAFWDDFYRLDYDALARHLDPAAEYTDVCSPADDVARGPAEVVARLRLAFDVGIELSDERRHLGAGGDAVLTEHVEHWRWPTGETMALPVMSAHQLAGGRITRWWDYWDMAALVAAAPAWWFEHVLAGWRKDPG